MNKNTFKYIVFAIAGITIVLWVLIEVFGVLPASLIWLPRIIVGIAFIVFLVYAQKKTGKSGGKKKGR